MKIIRLITYEEAETMDIGFWTFWWFFQKGMRWKDYIDIFKEEAHEKLEYYRKYIVDNEIKCTWEEQQNWYECLPLFDDGTSAMFSMRAWWDLMAAIWSEEENKDYCYMDFYC
jgi:hypothetical protein